MPSVRQATALEVWGGAEYTCNRVGDCYFDQMHISGHARRPRDLEAFAGLGIQQMRCGVLWERFAQQRCWSWTDEYLGAVRQAGMAPIVGLVHHGSGPPHTGLLDESFAPQLAAYAGKVAARYPWIEAYTPVNEPNTTARFACLYGMWHPHQRSTRHYYRALLAEIRATVLSMRAIRAVRSDARLVQTDDAGGVWSTPELAATADLLHERRWLSWDLLCGTVDRQHPLYPSMRAAGIPDTELLWFRDNPCPPDVVGLNYYVTSDRFLDHRVFLYPRSHRSAEGPFVDVEAVRVRPEGIQGFGAVLREAAERFGRPVAITEVHLGDRVSEQIRWADEAWRAAIKAQATGLGCVAVCFWALLGSYFWDELVIRDNGHYEPGAFDLSSGEPRQTELARFVRQCATGNQPQHSALRQPGWWRHPGRILYTPEDALIA